MQVIILFAHCHDDRVEFLDGFHMVDEILEAVPREARLIVDLNVCRCLRLAERLGLQRPFSLVKHDPRNRVSYPGAWFIFYRTLFPQLQQEELTYVDAVELNKSNLNNATWQPIKPGS